ncbi:uncharacterized protein Z518_06290 [Rhinocladiella mackenziei CBS 650.93]|uniref:Peptidase A1 domain-containing protein n=1 Tax=Rhinocladiella mackenziei CBS 650.93 TaxID=1442369 RepID=A0A0D2H4T4_9EURO|nr:uncharacterized protein Z518_06290 [Rhinocladiella mackenziei CBS 650.93]KIX05418.1 hypothetical protein Z518_06290 [Rhinocladiella mackenziei CBS 650.93]
MAYLSIVTCLILLSSVYPGYARPLHVRNPGLTIREVKERSPSSPQAHLVEAYRKYKAVLPDDVATALTNSLVAASPGAYDSRYLCPVTIGGQTLNLNLDTGSADLWVFSSELPESQSSGHTVYDASKSSTARPLEGYTWSITYADGSSASGNVMQDSVTIDNITVGTQAVELATQVSPSFQSDTESSGLLGLSFSTLNTVQPIQQLTWFDTAIQEGLLEAELFTANLKKGTTGSYDFGFIDQTKYLGEITYTKIDSSQGWWNITTTGYQVGSDIVRDVAMTGIVDTGTTLLIVDHSVVDDYWSNVEGAQYDTAQGGYVFPCASPLPDFALRIENHLATVPGSYLNFAPIDDSTCFGGMQANDGIGFSIFGDVFIKSQFVVFDKGNSSLGVASKSNVNATSSAVFFTNIGTSSSSGAIMLTSSTTKTTVDTSFTARSMASQASIPLLLTSPALSSSSSLVHNASSGLSPSSSLTGSEADTGVGSTSISISTPSSAATPITAPPSTPSSTTLTSSALGAISTVGAGAAIGPLIPAAAHSSVSTNFSAN